MTSSSAARLVICLAACGGSNSAAPDADPGIPGDAAVDSAPYTGDPLGGVGQVELVQGGFQFTEGPQWRDAEADLLFSDIPASTVHRYVPGGAIARFRMPSGNTNGNAIDPGGNLLAAEHGSRSVTRGGVGIASIFEGQPLNSPNDVIAAPDGTIYFTDPPYGIAAGDQRLTFNGVFRISPTGTLSAEHRGAASARPNGIGLAPQYDALYVADTADGNLYRFPINPGGALGTRAVLARTAGNPDGLALDEAGNVFVTTRSGVEVFSPAGARWGLIPVPQQPTNCAFGDADHRTLYITAQTSLYRVRLAHPGLPRN